MLYIIFLFVIQPEPKPQETKAVSAALGTTHWVALMLPSCMVVMLSSGQGMQGANPM